MIIRTRHVKSIITVLAAITFYLPLMICAQSISTPPDFGLIFYDPNPDTVDVDIKWYPRLDSIGNYLIEHPGCILYVYAHGAESKDGIHVIYGHCTNSTLNYFINRHDIPNDRIKLILNTRHKRGQIKLKIKTVD